MTNDNLNISPPAGGEAALAVTLAWLRAQNSKDEYGVLMLQPMDAADASSTLAKHLEAAGLRDWHDAIVNSAGSHQLQIAPHLGWLMAQAALEIAVDLDHPGIFQVVEVLQRLGGVSDATLAVAICDRVKKESDSYPLLAHLRRRMQMLWNSRFYDRLRQYSEASGTSTLTTRDLWPRYEGMPADEGWAHRVAATLWPERYMEMLASFPASFQLEFGNPLSPIDSELVESLIGASRDVFSVDGIPLGPVFVFVLLDAVETKFAAIDVQDLATAEVELGKVLDGVFSRSDGEWIGRAWLQQIIWRDTPRRAGRNQDDVTAQRTLRDTLLVQLASRIMPLGEAAFDWVRQEEPLWRVNRVLSEALILATHGDAASAAEILAGAVRQGLVSATGRPAGLATSSPEATIVSRVLSQLPDMKRWFEALWHDTYELREHLSYQAHRDLDNPAYPALTWGLIGLNSAQMSPVDTAGFWRAIAAAVFETQRIDPNASLFNGSMPPITRVMAQLGAVLTEHGTLPIRDFAEFMADQLEPTVEYARLWQIARSEASDNVTMSAGCLVGSVLIRQALDAGLTQHLPAWDVVLDRSARDDLADFANRL